MLQIIFSLLLTFVVMSVQAQEVFFQTDSALIRGRITDYSSTMGFQSLSVQMVDLFIDEHKVVSAEIREDGTFEKCLLLHHPVYNWFFTSAENIGKKQVPFYLCPGDTLNITITFNGKDIPQCSYSGGHADEVARLLQERTEYLDTYGQCISFAGDIPAYNHWADSVYTARLGKVEACATEHGFTPFERHLMRCDESANFGLAYLAYFSQIQTKLEQEDPSAIIGGKLPFIGGNSVVGKSDIIVSEACEYVNTFLKLHPAVSVILNVDADHLDFFNDIEDMEQIFKVNTFSLNWSVIWTETTSTILLASMMETST